MESARVAAVGVVFLVANARGLGRGEPSPFIHGASTGAETLLGASLVALAIVGAIDQLPLFPHLGSFVLAIAAVAWVAISVRRA